MMHTRRRFLACAAAGVLPSWRIRGAEPPSLPAWRLGADGWGKARTAEVTAVLNSAMRELWRHFPKRKLEPILVLRGRKGPIVHYQRNSLKEIIVQLDTQDLYWCQYAYQFSHEFCHILCGFDDDWKGNLWFEESLCEAASLFVLRRLALTWQKDAPFETWRPYAPRFREYTEDIIDRRVVIPDSKLPGFYKRHLAELMKNPEDRELNGTVALCLLNLLETAPYNWEAVTWLNSSPSPAGETFPAYLAKWRKAAPDRCRGFITEIAKRFGLKEEMEQAADSSQPLTIQSPPGTDRLSR